MQPDPHPSVLRTMQGRPGPAQSLQRGTLGMILVDQEGDLLLRALLLAVASAFFVILLSLATGLADSITVRVLQFSHVAMPVLAVGLVSIVGRHAWIGLVMFLSAFMIAELILLTRTVVEGWTSLGLVKGLIVALVTGGAAGFGARMVARMRWRPIQEVGPVLPALVAGALVMVVGMPLGLWALWIDVGDQISAEAYRHLGWLLVERQFRLGLIVMGAGLMMVVPPGRAALPEIVMVAASFVVLGLLSRMGFGLLPILDPALLGFLTVMLRPVRHSIPGVLIGITLFVGLTGVFVDLPRAMMPDEVQEGMIANVMLSLLVGLAAVRVRSTLAIEAQLQILGRMGRAQELARYGYFLYDPVKDVAVFDHMTQKILDVPARMSAAVFMARVHPEDRDAVAEAGDPTSEASVIYSFRFAMNGAWTPDCIERHFSGFKLGERQPDGTCIAFGLVVDVTREHVQEQHLRLVLNELSERQGQQKQLFSVISHELRTPASILSMIADELDDGKPWTEAGPRMRAVLEQLLSIMTDMRQAVLPEQNLPVRIEPMRPEDVALTVCHAFRPMAEARGIVMRTDLAPEAQMMRLCDRVRLNQTLSNLVKNAILHSQATEIRIAYDEAETGFATWTVSDNGRNLPPDQRERLFQPFVRGASGGMKTDGSGLGLYIAKGAIELLGGSLDYIDRPLSGAEFRIRLPLVLSEGPQGAEAGQAAQVEAMAETESLRVLLLEDSEPMGELLSARLAKSFADVTWLRDGASGLGWLALNDVDLIITDLYMPGMTGDELVRKLRQRRYANPIIGMTAADFGPDVERFRMAGADVVLPKPLKLQDVRLALARCKRNVVQG
ncbi:MAG: hybrid sensor histidine kinase/response regulator [Cypionkella sp.]|nr:hybrid sensor histidine kinase/response regulator [Cypionkella sp.]